MKKSIEIKIIKDLIAETKEKMKNLLYDEKYELQLFISELEKKLLS